jgi:hypothetical protein
MKDSRATISSIDQMINKTSLLRARDSWHEHRLRPPHAIATAKSSL